MGSVFNLDVATQLFSLGASPVDAIGIAFGVPDCLLEFGKSAALKFIPSNILNSVSNSVEEGRENAKTFKANVLDKLLTFHGLFEINTEKGIFRFSSDFSKEVLNQGESEVLNNLGGFSKAFGTAAQLGADLYENYKDINKLIGQQIACIDAYANYLKTTNGTSFGTGKSLGINSAAKFTKEIQRANEAQKFIDTADEVINNIAEIINERILNPALEPVFTGGILPSGTTFLEGASGLFSVETKPVFRLVFGPPKSKSGQFLLSVDGLYYDSQSGGLPVVSGFVPPETAYQFLQDANLGGKGQAISKDTLNKFIDTIFDPDKIDNSPSLLAQYKADHFLSVLEGQKDKQVSDFTKQVQKLVDAGSDENSAIIVNLKRSLVAIISGHEEKINKRKKQIEVAVKAPSLFGSNKPFAKGTIPVNDFSYLQNLNLAVAFENQKKLVFKQGEVSGVVLPLQPKFVKAKDKETQVFLADFVVPPVGKGGIIFTGSATTETTVAPMLNLTDAIVTDKLFAIYNFLEPIVVPRDSDKFEITNCATSGNGFNNAQLVSFDTENTFTQGLGIPFIQGITRWVLAPSAGINQGASPLASSFNELGSYLRLPDSKEYQDLGYKAPGFTMEVWTRMPGLGASSDTFATSGGWQTSSFHKLILANENTGGSLSAADANKVLFNDGSKTVRGLVCGYTRDRQIVKGQAPSDLEANNPINDAVFYIAPTQSVNGSDVTFVNRNDGGCASSFEVLKCTFPVSSVVAGVKYLDASSVFTLVDVAVDVSAGQVRLYCDGKLMATSSIELVFGTKKGVSPGIPTFIAPNSFENTKGPKLGQFFTPWIIGGGYTDGIPETGFMATSSGRKSGLQGYIGSLKFYSKPLTTEEVRKNFNAQSGFFKNIVI